MSNNFQRWDRFMNGLSGLAGFGAALGDFRDGGFQDFELGVRRADGKRLLLYANDLANDAAGGHDAVAGLDGFEQGFLLLGALALGRDEQEIKDDDHEHEHAHAVKHLSLWIGLRSS